MLDGRSLHQARQVCQGWNEAILSLVWGEDRVAVETKLKNNWRFAQPSRIERTLKFDGTRGALLGFNLKKTVMIFSELEDEDEDVKIVEFTTQDGKVLSKQFLVIGITMIGLMSILFIMRQPKKSKSGKPNIR